MKAVFVAASHETLHEVYADRIERILKLCECGYHPIVSSEKEKLLSDYADCDVIFATWGMPVLNTDELKKLPNLKSIFYAAGSVNYFAKPLLEAGIRLFNAKQANAIPVAEYNLAHCLLGLKHAYAVSRELTHESQRPNIPITGAYGGTVGIVSLGMTGSRLAQILKPFDIQVIAYDPYASEQTFAECECEPCSLEAIFETANVVSINTPDIAETQGMIRAEHIRSMKPWSTLINSARAGVIQQDEMATTLKERGDITAILDVVNYDEDSFGVLKNMHNVILSHHIAGSLGNECHRMADIIIESFIQWKKGQAPANEVTLPMLERTA